MKAKDTAKRNKYYHCLEYDHDQTGDICLIACGMERCDPGVNYGPDVRDCYQIPVYGNPNAFILVKYLQNGDFALGFFNFGDVAAKVTLDFWDTGLPYASGCSLHFHDCLSHKEIGNLKEFFAPTVAAHGCKVYRCSIMENEV